jgi:1,4-alpha-glucan branching enzyme
LYDWRESNFRHYTVDGIRADAVSGLMLVWSDNKASQSDRQKRERWFSSEQTKAALNIEGLYRVAVGLEQPTCRMRSPQTSSN